MIDDTSYIFMTLPADTLEPHPDFQARDAAYFERNPERSYHVRPSYDGEIEEGEDDSSICAIVHKDPEGHLGYRVITVTGVYPDDTEINGRWFWQIWEADDMGGVIFHDFEVFLLEKVFQNLNRTRDSGA